jgi:hypothetical protein
MHKRRWILIAALLAGLVLVLAACGGGDDPTPTQAEPTQAAQAKPTEEPQPEPTDTQPPPTATSAPEAEPTEEPEPEPVEDETLDPTTLSATAALSSFRSNMRIVITADEDGEEAEQVLEFAIEYTSDPEAQHITMSGSDFGDAGAADVIDSYVVEGTMYTRFDDQWMSFPATEGDLGAEGLIDPDEMIDGTCGWKKEERTDIDGVPSQHWTLSYEDMMECAPPTELATMGELSDLGGDIYVALDEGYITQMDIYYIGEGLDLGLDEASEEQKAGRIDFHYTVTDANEPFTIELPEEAKASSTRPEDLPIPDDAEEVSTMFGMTLFTSPSKPEEIADFYKAAMADYGWTETDSSEMAGMFMLEFTKDNQTASLIINTDDSGDTSVMITIQEE